MSENTLHSALKRHFGFDTFLEGQQAVLGAVMDRQDCLAIMPTGGGKSLCYQLPAMLLDGLTLVVSPLIALMKDQVDGLQSHAIPAAFINSTLGPSEMDHRLEAMAAGDYRLLYVAPERFRSSRFMEVLRYTRISLVAVDEAHCVSMWGHDFRPDYLELKTVLTRLGRPQVLGLTATATPEVREDVLAQLGLGVPPRRAPAVVVRGFGRSELNLWVTRVGGRAQKLARLLTILDEHSTGIVYCATRKNVEWVTQALTNEGVACMGYHAGMAETPRRHAHQQFQERKVDVVVATNAFGMGIDRPDLRAIVHWDIPGSVETYYQEAGRAGRDGRPARCELLFNFADVRTQEFFIEGANPPVEFIRGVAQAVHSLAEKGSAPPTRDAVARRADPTGDAHPFALHTTLTVLERMGVVTRVREAGSDNVLVIPDETARHRPLPDLSFVEEKARRDRTRLRRLLRYVDNRNCRHETILLYFGDPAAQATCGSRCDNCRRRTSRTRAQPAPLTRVQQVQVQKVLSCVARMGGRFGRTRVAQVLAGSRDQAVLRVGLDRIPTYGALRDLSIHRIRTLIDSLEDFGHLEPTGDEYPLIRLTDRGREAVRDPGEIRMEWPSPPRARPARLAGPPGPPGSPGPSGGRQVGDTRAASASPKLAEALKNWRLELARSRGKPAFTILHDQTLYDIARLRPQTLDQLLGIKGIGPAKLESLGEMILEVVRTSS